MSFSNFVCWKAEMLQKVMDTEALQAADHIFLATHHPVKMYREDIASARVEYNENQLLSDLLSPNDYIFIAVLGDSGTGKSHLVGWVNANLPRTEKRRVLLIPKANTNLKKIIAQVLDGMEGEHFDEYRRRLEQATASLSEGKAREILLSNLALAVGPHGPHADSNLTDIQQYLVAELPNLLHDPFFRQHLLKDGSIINRLTVHILGNLNMADRVEDRRGFSLEDLPLNIADIRQASAQARNFYSYLLGNEVLQEEAVEWLNTNLDDAIARVLNFNGEDLMDLMLEVREVLAEQGIELVILIEDFAKLQGIDQQLLEVLLVRPRQPNRKTLCALRTVMAVTTGYFKRFPDTVQTRIQFRVNLDVETGEAQGLVSLEDITKFAARYLNAVRMEDSVLRSWYDTAVGRRESKQEPPSACSYYECPHLDKCHGAFGTLDGYGLYPFTRKAIKRMMDRVIKDKFNPRQLINHVLKHILENYGEHLVAGNFPPPQLLQHFGDSSISAFVQTQLRRDAVNFPRRQVLLEFWSDADKAVDLNPVIHEAFSLPPLGVPVTEEEDDGGGSGGVRNKEGVDDPPKETELFPPSLMNKLDSLDKWANGTELPQELTNELRELIFNSISNRIDWDAELLLANFFKGDTRLFQKPSINFKNQATQLGAQGKVQLIIPLEGQVISDTAVALQGLLKYNRLGHWSFPGGEKQFRLYAWQLDQWAEHVLRKVKNAAVPTGEWDPVPSVTQLLALGSALSGYPSLDGGQSDMQLDALFKMPVLQGQEKRAQTWKAMLSEFDRHRDALKNILLVHTACTKGGRQNVKVIDAASLVGPLVRLSEENWFAESLPEKLRGEYEVILRIWRKFHSQLEGAIKDEKQRCLEWHEKLKNLLGAESRADAATSVRRVVESARAEGVFPGIRADQLEQAISRFDTDEVDRCMEMTARLSSLSDKNEVLMALGSLNQFVMSDVEEFITQINAFFAGAKDRLKSDVDDCKGSGGQDFLAVRNAINENLQELIELANLLGGQKYADGTS